MQRQSLGSPVSKGLPKEDSRLIELQPSSSSLVTDYDNDDNKTAKPRRLSLSPPAPLSAHSQPEKLIHLIPILTLFCFLVLYLSSHSPSQSDLAQFSGFKRPSNHIDSSSNEIQDFSRFIELRRGDFLATRSLRNFQEIEKHAPKSRPHRKIADF